MISTFAPTSMPRKRISSSSAIAMEKTISPSPTALGPCCPSGFGSGDNIDHPRGWAAGYTRIFSPNIVNEFRFGDISTVYGYNPPNINQRLGAAIGIPGANPTALLGGQVLIGGNGGR